MKHTPPSAFHSAPLLAEDLSPEDYLSFLHPDGSHGGPGLLCFHPDFGHVSWTFEAEYLPAHLPMFLPHPTYVSMNRFTKRTKRSNKSLRALNAIWLDLDYHTTLEWRDKSADAVRRALSLHLQRKSIPEPSFLISSGRGLYAIWLISETPPAALIRWKEAQKALLQAASSFGADPACADEARVLRMPGSINQKNGKPVQILSGSLQRYCFDALSDAIFAGCGRPTRRKLQTRKKNGTSTGIEGKGSTMPKGLTQAERHRQILSDLETYRLHQGGLIPGGQRALFLHLYATCLTHIPEVGDIEALVSNMAALATPGLKPAEVRSVIKQSLDRASLSVSHNPWQGMRYAYRGETIAEKLNISTMQARKMGLKQIMPQEERKRRKAEAQKNNRRKVGVRSREDYLKENRASREKPWEQYGLGRSQYYARKKLGNLPAKLS